MRYDLTIRGGTVIDPAAGLHATFDVAILDGKIAAIARSIAAEAKDAIDASGLLVVPGLVDLHTHVYEGVSTLAVDVDRACLEHGVTTVVDAGSAGATTFHGFRRYVIESARTRILAFLHLSAMGLIEDELGELTDLRWAMVDRAVAVAQANRDLVVGIKIRLSERLVGKHGDAVLDRALEAGDAVGRPLMVHIGGTKRPLGEILERLRPGDIVTHCFTGWKPGILGGDGHIIPEAIAARERGVRFDVGHGAGSFSFATAERALADGFPPDTISTDLHRFNVDGPVFDLVTTLSKFLGLGLSLDHVIEMATSAPARVLGRAEQFGSLRVGSPADVTILRLNEGRFTLVDATGDSRTADHRLEPVLTLRAGRRPPT